MKESNQPGDWMVVHIHQTPFGTGYRCFFKRTCKNYLLFPLLSRGALSMVNRTTQFKANLSRFPCMSLATSVISLSLSLSPHSPLLYQIGCIRLSLSSVSLSLSLSHTHTHICSLAYLPPIRNIVVRTRDEPLQVFLRQGRSSTLLAEVEEEGRRSSSRYI
ncbi:hypothetical protein GOP47_0024275 [Adiantum capillus-veneris]|uniref:Uncharacterized protein n=1 Tax=Adiantum capillus-veneris TaxID=13818 RepID=A0A9D4U632_ADICA|nr:hypothetical protein GOP47_0024275 [Adiantum capillus-veneris]